MSEWWESAPLAEQNAGGNWWESAPLVPKPEAAPSAPKPAPSAPKPAPSALSDIAMQAPQGFNLGLDSILNAPYNIIRSGAGLAGYDIPAARNLISEQVNTGIPPQTSAGRIARTAGEVAGANVIPAAGTYAAAGRAAPLVAPTGTAAGIGHEALQAIRANLGQAMRADAASTIGAGLASGAAKEAGAGDTGQMLSAFSGGMAPSLVSSGVRVAGEVAGRLGSRTTGITSKAENSTDAMARIRSALEQDARATPGGVMSDAEFAAAQARGQPVVNLDLGGESTRRLARSAANQSPEAAGMLKTPVADRYATQADRVSQFVAGPETATQVRDAMAEAARTSRQPLYDRAFSEGAAGIDGQWLESLQRAPALQRAMSEAETRLQNRTAVAVANGEQRVPQALGQNGNTLEFWDAAKQSLDDDINRAIERGQNGHARELIGVRDRLVSGLDSSVGSYAAARGRASQIFGTSDAVTAGERFASPSGRFSNETVHAALGDMTSAERQAFEAGFTSRLQQQLSELGDNRNAAAQLLNSPATRARMEMAFGAQRTREITDALAVERRMQSGYHDLTGNSSTAMFQKDLQHLAVPMGETYNPAPHPTLWGTLGGDAFHNWKSGNLNKAADQRAMEIARALSSSDPSMVNSWVPAQSAGGMESARAGLTRAMMVTAPGVTVTSPNEDELRKKLRQSLMESK